MNGQLNLFQTPARNTDPQTSHEAAQANQKERQTLAMRVLEVLKASPVPLADFEIANRLGALRGSVAKRRQELQNAGLVEQAEGSVITDTGSRANVWRAKR
jgi:Mn-dependent DtxR family transcriptional regulator